MCLAVPGRLLKVQGEEPLWLTGRVDFGGVIKEVSLACVPEAVAGEYVMVHAGVAISRLDEEEALRLLDSLRSIEGLSEPGEDAP
jgi:hydrogenase expression/formation protein HypC